MTDSKKKSEYILNVAIKTPNVLGHYKNDKSLDIPYDITSNYFGGSAIVEHRGHTYRNYTIDIERCDVNEEGEVKGDGVVHRLEARYDTCCGDDTSETLFVLSNDRPAIRLFEEVLEYLGISKESIKMKRRMKKIKRDIEKAMDKLKWIV